MKRHTSRMRYDLQMIVSWIEPGSKVLDLGCGEGDLLYFLREHKQVGGVGIERIESKVAAGIERGLSILQGDINEEILDYPDDSFDYVVLSQTLQQVYEPDKLIKALLRVGNKGIVTFPNFSHWGIRLRLLLTGHAPITKQLPYQWYDTPNIRVITIKDFRRFSRRVGFRILKEAAINSKDDDRSGKVIDFLPTLRATYGLYLIGRE
jgi:methionine biosynthesis protein MetW